MRIGQKPSSRRKDSNRGPLAPKISPTPLNACVSNAPSAQREQNPGGFVPKLFPNSRPLATQNGLPARQGPDLDFTRSGSGSEDGNKTRTKPSEVLESEIRRFADRLRRVFADELRHDARAFKKRVLRLIRCQLPPQRGRPCDPKTEAALELIREGKTVRQVLRLQVRGFDRLDSYGRYLTEKALRQAISRWRRRQARSALS